MPIPSRSRLHARRRGRVGLRILASCAALGLVAAGGLYFYLRSSLPQTSGRIAVTGPKATIHIARDADGVPTITAQSDEEAAFGLGFVHAQDRLFQMELMRILGLNRAAQDEIPALSAELNRALSAYAAGVNAFLSSRRGALPLEFRLLRFS